MAGPHRPPLRPDRSADLLTPQPRPGLGAAGRPRARPRLGSARRDAGRARRAHRHRARRAAGDDDRRVGALAAGHACTPPGTAQETFDTYVRQDSVLLAPGEAGHQPVPRLASAGPGRGGQPARSGRACPACAADPDPRRALAWRAAAHDRLPRARLPPRGRPRGRRRRRATARSRGRCRCRRAAGHPGPLHLRGAHHRPGRAARPRRPRRRVVPPAALAAGRGQPRRLPPVSTHGRATLERVWQATGRPRRAAA